MTAATQNNTVHQKNHWTTKKLILVIAGGLLFAYLVAMTYLYSHPILGFTPELPVNPPSVLEAKQQTIQAHIAAPRLPWGLEKLEFFIVPPYSTTFYANVDGGALVEKKAAGAPLCAATAFANCETATTPGGQKYTLVTVKDSSGKIIEVTIVFTRNNIDISIELTKRPRALDRSAMNAYIDSFQPAHESFLVDHITPGP